MGIGQELVAVAEQAAAGHTELQTHTVGTQRLHLLQDGLALAQTGHDSTLILSGDVDDDVLHRLVGLAVDDLGQNVRGRDLQLIAFAAHGLDEDGQMHLTTAHDTEGISGGGILYLQSDVLQKLFLQTVTDLAAGDILALTAGQRAVVDQKVISTVGSLIFTKGSGSILEGLHRVLPMVTSGRPEKATMSPAVMLSQG